MDVDRRALAVEELRALGATLAPEHGRVADLSADIRRRRHARTRRFDYYRQCDGKERYATPESAARIAKRMRFAVAPYRCPHCGYWHLGHEPKA